MKPRHFTELMIPWIWNERQIDNCIKRPSILTTNPWRGTINCTFTTRRASIDNSFISALCINKGIYLSINDKEPWWRKKVNDWQAIDGVIDEWQRNRCTELKKLSDSHMHQPAFKSLTLCDLSTYTRSDTASFALCQQRKLYLTVELRLFLDHTYIWLFYWTVWTR